jgi:hypothetical protein
VKLYLPEKFVELGEVICKEPIYIDVYYVDRKEKFVYFCWDFGMNGTVGLKSFNLADVKGLKNKIMSDVIFDIGHAFFHYKGDPNYTHYHWALYAWLKDRVETKEIYEQPN